MNSPKCSILGFSKVWYDQMEKAYLIHAYVKNQQKFPKRHRKPFSMEDLQTPFFILIVGHTMSFVVFLMEKFMASAEKKWKITAFLWTIWCLKYKKKQFSVSSCKRSENSIKFNRQISRIIGNWKVFILYVLVCANPSLFYVKRLIMKYYFIWNAACDPK